MMVAERHHPELCDPVEHARHTGRYELAADLIGTRGGVWLDMGCGYGYGTALLAERTDADLVVGVDPDEGATLYAAGNYHGMHTMFVNASAAESGEHFLEQFDAIVCIEVLEHLPQAAQEGFLRDMKAMMAQDAALVLMCPIGHGPNNGNPWHLHEPTAFELKTILHDAGFYVESFVVQDYDSTSGSAKQATILCR